ncbi:unnamed protein product [Spirodela intermedia]|uniref:Uncharacterized protein n=1 Tax=Spirodela intermedia TaxID=51605 RepID=A0A7I8KB81_SPIIN|nr:unnamed protein product [Spirodela intermedia]
MMVARGRSSAAAAAAVAALMMALTAGMGGGLVSGAVVQFIFGDSLIDVGNNNYLSKSLARATLPWYGIDFGNGLPNGRYSNGRTVSDIVGDMMGLPRPPAFLDPAVNEDVILASGLNYASGGAGILNETSSFFIQRLSLYKQIELFQGTQTIIGRKIGGEAAQKFFKEARYVVSLGSNDYINNFLMPFSSDWSYGSDKFSDYLMSTLDSQLRLLYSLGARKLMFFGLGPMGCIPLQRFFLSSGECRESTNQLALDFNKKARRLIEGLSASLTGAAFSYGDAYDIVLDIVAKPLKYGFNESYEPCCTLGRIRPTLTCTPLSSLCKDRSKYVFWDEYHPTDRANEIIAVAIARKLGIAPVKATVPLTR